MSKTNGKVLFALTLVHFTGDFYSAMTTPLYPLFVQKLGLSLSEIGLISGINLFLAFIVQPSVGYMADRRPPKMFAFMGLLMPIVFVPLSGIMPGFWSLLAVIALGSIGSSMFHPPVTGMVPAYAGSNPGLAMSVFNTGGTFAFGLAPIFITWYAVRFGLAAVPLTMVFGLLTTIWLFSAVPSPQRDFNRTRGFWNSIKECMGDSWKLIVRIWLIMVVRALVGQMFIIFMPVNLVQKGFPIISAGAVFSLFTVCGTISGLIAGHVSDRIGFKPVFLFCHLLMAPALLLFLKMEGVWVFFGAALAGAFVFATLPLGVAMGQKAAPRGRSMVASLMMGFAFGLGGILAPLAGKLADIYSIEAVLWVMAWLPLLSLPLVFGLPRRRLG